MWKLLLVLGSVVIIAGTLVYTNLIVNKIAEDERNKVALWAEAIKRKANLVSYSTVLFNKLADEEQKKMHVWAEATKRLLVSQNPEESLFFLEIIKGNTTIPVILTNADNTVQTWANIDSVPDSGPLTPHQRDYLNKELVKMQEIRPPIVLDIYKGIENKIYYRNSKVYDELRYALDGLLKSFFAEIEINSVSVPVLYTDSSRTKVIAFSNIDSSKLTDPAFLKSTIHAFSLRKNPIEIELDKGVRNYIYYEDSFLLTQLKFYPYFQFAVITLFIIIAYFLFDTDRRSQQNLVWVGMAKETAHQLGTPISSLIGWVEYLRLKGMQEEMLNEIEKDIGRLQTITERFSKIGSSPELKRTDIVSVIENSVQYLRTRVSSRISIEVVNMEKLPIHCMLNIPLFEWVIENICKNAIDAMPGSGSIQLNLATQNKTIYLDIRDSGKGIPKNLFKSVFQPGYTTKSRGWGLGLTLVKRIIREYHKGEIFVKESEIGKGTTFRIILKKA